SVRRRPVADGFAREKRPSARAGAIPRTHARNRVFARRRWGLADLRDGPHGVLGFFPCTTLAHAYVRPGERPATATQTHAPDHTEPVRPHRNRTLKPSTSDRPVTLPPFPGSHGERGEHLRGFDRPRVRSLHDRPAPIARSPARPSPAGPPSRARRDSPRAP